MPLLVSSKVMAQDQEASEGAGLQAKPWPSWWCSTAQLQGTQPMQRAVAGDLQPLDTMRLPGLSLAWTRHLLQHPSWAPHWCTDTSHQLPLARVAQTTCFASFFFPTAPEVFLENPGREASNCRANSGLTAGLLNPHPQSPLGSSGCSFTA